jgi:hypothetical protein
MDRSSGAAARSDTVTSGDVLVSGDVVAGNRTLWDRVTG